MENVNPEGLRLDGRRPLEMRHLRAEIGVVSRADGSAVFEMGNTKVIAAVYGPREVQVKSQQINDQAVVLCEYSMANFSTGDRVRKPKRDRRSTEISLVIRQTMEAFILTHLTPRSQIDIFVQVLQADGGTRSACIYAATVALADAGIPMRDLISTMLKIVLEALCHSRNSSKVGQSDPPPDFPRLPALYAPHRKRKFFFSILLSYSFYSPQIKFLAGMDAKLPMVTFETVMQFAREGCKAVANYIREILLENTKQLEFPGVYGSQH